MNGDSAKFDHARIYYSKTFARHFGSFVFEVDGKRYEGVEYCYGGEAPISLCYSDWKFVWAGNVLHPDFKVIKKKAPTFKSFKGEWTVETQDKKLVIAHAESGTGTFNRFEDAKRDILSRMSDQELSLLQKIRDVRAQMKEIREMSERVARVRKAMTGIYKAKI